MPPSRPAAGGAARCRRAGCSARRRCSGGGAGSGGAANAAMLLACKVAAMVERLPAVALGGGHSALRTVVAAGLQQAAESQPLPGAFTPGHSGLGFLRVAELRRSEQAEEGGWKGTHRLVAPTGARGAHWAEPTQCVQRPCNHLTLSITIPSSPPSLASSAAACPSPVLSPAGPGPRRRHGYV